MNGTLRFNDTFDNLSFSESLRFSTHNDSLNLKTTPGVAEKLKNNYSAGVSSVNHNNSSNQEIITSNDVTQNISVDDSIFLSESLPLQDNKNVEIRKLNSKDNEDMYHNVNIGNSEELFTNTSQPIFDFQTETISNGSDNVEIESKTDIKALKTLENYELSSWGLPDSILQKYKSRGVTRMFHWQAECLVNKNILENNANLIYSAPTSAGKTLVAEILAIKTILERHKKVLFILPFISVVREKMFYFQDILGSSGVRVEGFMGSHNPPGGFTAVQLAICTIEKANGIINRLMEEGTLADIGAVIVDEMHLLGDSSRGYLLELMLTKLQYMSVRFENIQIQIIGMSATLPNLNLLGKWLNAELYVTDFRPIPLNEQCLVNGEVYNKNLILERRLLNLPELETDTDNILQLCLETIQNSCSVLIFCPTKNWCENLAQQIAVAFWKLGCSKTPFGIVLREQLNCDLITELIEQLKRCPVGLDNILRKTVSYGVAFHHAGLTMDERDIVEAAFRNGVLRVLVATSTLSSGVNLPARRVIIRTPMFHGKPIDSLVYRQMIGRAGRMGKDSAGESILICQKNDYRIAKELLSAELQPIESCLEGAGKLKRAILEVVASGVAATPEDVRLFTNCTLLAVSEEKNEDHLMNPIEESIRFLRKNEFIRLQTLDDGSSKYIATPLAKACLSSSMPPEEGLALFAELEKARQCFVLEAELHLIYLVTPYSACNQWGNLDWMLFLELWEKLPPSMKRVGELVGIRESYIINGTRNKIQTNTSKLYQQLQIHRRFFTALALQDLVNEVPLNDVAIKFGCSRGMLQSLQQSASTFAGMLTIFSRQLGWSSVEILISQFQDRMQFGISRDLLDLMRLPILNGPRARALYNAGIETLVNLASSDIYTIENILHKIGPFESGKERDGESEYAANKRNKIRGVWVTGKEGMTEREAAAMLIQDARRYLQLEMGLVEVKWEKETADSQTNASLKKMQTGEVAATDKNSPLSPDVAKADLSKVVAKSDSIVENIANDKKLEIDPISADKLNTREISTNENNEEDLDSTVSLELNSSTELEPQIKENEGLSFELGLSSNSLNLTNAIINLHLTSNVTKTQSNDETPNLIERNEVIVLNNSDQSLFEDSLELISNYTHRKEAGNSFNNEINSSNNTNVDSGLDFVSGSFLENAFVSSFDLKPEITQDVINFQCDDKSLLTNHSSTVSINNVKSNSPNFSPNNDLIIDSQTNISNSLSLSKECEFLKYPSRICRKRRRSTLDLYKSSVIDGEESFDCIEAPTKKKKAQTCCGDLNIVNTSANFSYKPENSTPVDLTNLQIVDVCKDEKLFETFSTELFQQKIISLSFACTKIAEHNPAIGINILGNNSVKTNIPAVDGFVHKHRHVIGVAINWGNNTAYYIPFDNKTKVANISKTAILNDLFSQKMAKLRMFDCKEQIKVANLCCGFNISCTVEDPKVADWLLEPEGREKNLQAMAVTYAPEAVKLSQLAGNYKGVGSIGLELCSSIEPRIRAAVEAVVTWHLCESVCDTLMEQNEILLDTYKTEMGIILCLARMELNGLGVNMSKLQDFACNIKHHMECLEKQAYSLAGCRFSLTSSKDVAKILGIHKGRKVSTSKETLEELDDPIASLILQWRKLSSTLTKMIYPLVRLAENSRIYGTCVTHTSTGRVTMHEPNLQNIPRDFDVNDGANCTTLSCRNVFVPDDKCVFLSADYCQLELRLLAHFSKDPLLCSVVKSGEDVFKSVAAIWKNISETQVDDVLRQWAKQLCYGIIYGMGIKTLAKQLAVPDEEASEFRESFRDRYPNIQKYVQETVENCKNLGYIETLAGRRRYLPNINHENPVVRSQAERQAVNTTVQGSAADLIKAAMVLLEDRFRTKFIHSKNVPKLVLQLHDELLYEVPKKYLFQTAKILKKCMEEAVELSVPFPVKLKSGSSWGTMKELVL